MRPIDADLLKETEVDVAECETGTPTLTKAGQNLLRAMFETFGEGIDSIPTLDVQPVVHAHWISKKNINNEADNNTRSIIHFEHICSNCKKAHYSLDEVCEQKYCDECGAKMDGGAKNGIC